MHRTVQSNSYGSNETIIANHKNTVVTKIATYSTYDSQCNDGINESGKYTIGLSVAFQGVSDANEFNNWLKELYYDNSSDFEYARTRIHDCYHAEYESKPCKIGDVWEL